MLILVGLPVALTVLALFNFTVIGGLDATVPIVVAPVVVGLTIGGLLVRNRIRERVLATAKRQLEQSHAALQQTVTRMQRVQGAALRALGSVHDFRNLLTPILLVGELVEPRNNTEKQAIQGVLSSAERALELSNNILAHLSDKGGEPTLHEATVLLDRTIRQARQLIPYHVEVRDQIQPGRVRVDAEDLLQVLHNLFANAVAARSAGLVIEVRGAPAERGYRIEVVDNGPGIPDAVVRNLGEIQEREDGTVHGLGLALVAHQIKRNAGELHIEGSSEGTRVHLDLPSE